MTAWFLAGDVFDQSIAKSMTEPQGQCKVYNEKCIVYNVEWIIDN
jgi:hypothetical protein